MITLNALLSTLTQLNTSGLLEFSVKLLNLSTHSIHLLSVIRRILRQVVGDNKFCLVVETITWNNFTF